MSDEEESILAELDARLDEAVDAIVDGAGKVTLLYSGGVDSTLVALALLPEHPVEALVVSTRTGRDSDRARASGASIRLPVRQVVLEDADVRWVLETERDSLAGLKEPARSVQVSLALAVRASSTHRIVTGQGADELFGGYAHFRGLRTEEAEARRGADLRKLIESDWPLSRAIAERLGHDLRSPFLEPGFLRYARSLALKPLSPEALTKPLLRRWARHRGVPDAIAYEPKHAMQYGSGVAAAVARATRERGPVRDRA